MRKRTSNTSIAVAMVMAAAMLFAIPGQAEEVAPTVPTFGDLSKLQAQEMYWDLRGKRDQKRADAVKFNPEPGINSAPGSPSNSVPKLEGIVGSGLNLYGTFVYDNGAEVEARPGDILPGGYRVSSLSATKAKLLVNGKSIELLRSTPGNRSSGEFSPGAAQMLPGSMILPGSPAPVR
jgi:type IV pilus biogenesis protein PilP